MSSGYDEIEFITRLLEEVRDNYYEILSMLDEMEEENLVLDEEYKRIIDTIRGIQKR